MAFSYQFYILLNVTISLPASHFLRSRSEGVQGNHWGGIACLSRLAGIDWNMRDIALKSNKLNDL